MTKTKKKQLGGEPCSSERAALSRCEAKEEAKKKKNIDWKPAK